MKSRARRIALVVLAGALALVITAGVVAASFFPSARLTPLVRDGFARALKAPVGLREARLALFPWPSVALTDLVIGDPAGYVRPRAWPRGGLAAARSARAAIELGPLFSRRIAIREIVLEDVRVTLVRNESGLGNWEGLGGPRKAGSAGRSFEVSLRKLELANARAQYYDARDGTWFEVRRLDQELIVNAGNRGRDHRIRTLARAQGLGGRTPWPVGARPVTFEADFESKGAGASWLVRKVGIERGALKLSGRGTVEGPERVLDFKLDQAAVPLDALLELLPTDQNARLGDLGGKGTVRLGFEAKGPLTKGRKPRVRARALLDHGRLAFRSRALALEDLSCDILATEDGADFKRVAGRIGRSVFEFSGISRGWSDPRLKGRLQANADLADVGRFLPLADSTRLAGLVRADLEGAGRPGGGVGAFGWSGRLQLSGVSAAGMGLGYPVSDVNGVLGLAPDRAWATGLSARLGRSDVVVDGTVEHPFEYWTALTHPDQPPPAGAVARFALRSRQVDGDELFPRQRTNTPLPRVRAEGTFAIGAFKLQRLSGRNAVGRLVYENGVTTIPEMAFDAYEGRVRGSGWFDFVDRTVPRYKVQAYAERVDANALLKAWTPVKDVAFGTLEMSLTFDGSGLDRQQIAKSLSGSGLAQILGGRLAGARVLERLAQFTGVDRLKLLSFRDLSAPFRLSNGRVILDPLAITTGGTDWFAKGSVGLDGSLDFRIAALIPQNELGSFPASVVRTAGVLLGKDGKVALDMVLRGTVQKPEFAWDSERAASRLFERGEEQLEDLARRLGGSLADSLLGSKTKEDRAQDLLASQQQRLEDEAQKRMDDLTKKAMEDLEALFRKPARPAPPPPDTSAGPAPAPPGAPADTTAVPVPAAPPAPSAPDTTALDSTFVPGK